MFQKIGDAQPLDLVHTCCVCEMAACIEVSGKYYCNEHLPQQSQETKENDINEKQQ